MTRLAPGLVAMLLAVPALAQAEWRPELQRLEPLRRPDDVVTLLLPEPAPSDLSLEIDGLDVSPIAVRSPGRIELRPHTPLAAGEHLLRLVERRADGSIVEHGRWTLSVGETPAAPSFERSFQAFMNADLSERVGEKTRDGKPQRLIAQGSGAFSGRLAGEGWHLDGAADLVLNTNRQSNLSGRELDLGRFLLDLGYHGAGLAIGQHTPGTWGGAMPRAGLAWDVQARRGVSVGYRREDGRFGATAFSQRNTPVSGFEGGLAFGDADDRLRGVAVSAVPLAREDRQIDVGLRYVAARAPDPSALYANDGLGGLPPPRDTVAYSVVVDSQWWQRRLRLRAELAETGLAETDADGGRLRDRGYSLLAELQSAPSTGAELRSWNLSLHWQRIGSFFRSEANPYAPVDGETLTASASGQRGPWSGQLQLSQLTDNVNDLPVPTVRVRAANAQLGWQAQRPHGGLGTPSLTVFAARDARQETERPAASAAYPTDDFTESGGMQWRSRWPGVSIGLSQTLTRFSDREDLQSDYRDALTALDLSWQLDGGASLAPILQYDVYEDESFGVTTRTLSAALSVSDSLLSDRLAANLSASLNHVRDSADFQDNRFVQCSFGLSWTTLAAAESRPGLLLWLRGSYSNRDDRINPFFGAEDYELFLGLSLSWEPQ